MKHLSDIGRYNEGLRACPFLVTLKFHMSYHAYLQIPLSIHAVSVVQRNDLDFKPHMLAVVLKMERRLRSKTS